MNAIRHRFAVRAYALDTHNTVKRPGEMEKYRIEAAEPDTVHNHHAHGGIRNLICGKFVRACGACHGVLVENRQGFGKAGMQNSKAVITLEIGKQRIILFNLYATDQDAQGRKEKKDNLIFQAGSPEKMFSI